MILRWHWMKDVERRFVEYCMLRYSGHVQGTAALSFDTSIACSSEEIETVKLLSCTAVAISRLTQDDTSLNDRFARLNRGVSLA